MNYLKARLTLLILLFPALMAAQQFAITHGPYLQNISEQEVTIIWTTNQDALSWVELAPAGDDSFYARERERFFETAHGTKNTGTLHRITLHDLEPGTSYRYRIFSRQVIARQSHKVFYGDVVATDVFRRQPLSFTTLDHEKKSIFFRVVNDIHAQNDHLRQLLPRDMKKNTDLVIFNGDMISLLNSENEIFTGFMDTAVELFASEVPMFLARGNHETRGEASPRLYSYFPTNNGHFYYSFRHGPVQFLVLDSGEDKPDSDIEYGDLAHYDAYREEERSWIEEQVNSKEFRQAPYRVVVMHIPPAGSSWHGTLDVAARFLPVLNRADIDLMLCGHTHDYQFIEKGAAAGVDFPVLINDDENCLDITADGHAITVVVKGLTGNRITTHKFRRK